MKKAPYSVRHGDVLLVDAAYRRRDLSGATEIPPEGNRVILAHGEVTGHAHVCVIDREKPQARLMEIAAERYLQIVEKVALSHEEHTAILLRKGKLQQGFQVEERGEKVRSVQD